MRRISIAAVALALAALAVPVSPAQAKTIVGINECYLGPSNAGQCTIVITEPDVYLLGISSWGTDYAWASLSCTDGTVLHVWIEGAQSDTQWDFIDRGTCTMAMESQGDVATADLAPKV